MPTQHGGEHHGGAQGLCQQLRNADALRRARGGGGGGVHSGQRVIRLAVQPQRCAPEPGTL